MQETFYFGFCSIVVGEVLFAKEKSVNMSWMDFIRDEKL